MIMDPFFLYHYSSQLETTSTRFSSPGSYAFYLIFVAFTILVSVVLPVHCIISFLPTSLQPRNICPVSLFLAVTVPGIEGDYPCTVQRPSFAKFKRAFVECGLGGMPH
jgi:hypothetical protein